MKQMKQYLLEEIATEIGAKEREIAEADEELVILAARLKVENAALDMEDVIREHLEEDFRYSAQALESMIVMEQDRHSALTKDLHILRYRKAVIEKKFSDDELEY